MEKIELNPSLKDWLDYMNATYEWSEEIGMNDAAITPRLIELVLRTDGYITRKEK